MNTRFTRLAGICGLLTPIITLTLIFVSIRLSPWFSWHDNALSDMGVSTTPNVLNAALLIGGGLQLVFVLGGLRPAIGPGKLARLGFWALLIGALALPLVGIFTEAYGRTHYYIAATYFLATPLGYILLGSATIKRGQPVEGSLSMAAGIAAILAITLVPHKRIAVPEILAATILGAWTFAMGVKSLFGNSTQS
ncbi:MAG TPA: DUF998 domain-containing protein [Anaerolineae bacterium]|nr:DUF998 domain-containing protein [Anaerolineae bacterium]